MTTSPARRALMALMAVLTIGLYAALPAAAITGGTIDSNGTYSNVGMIAYYDAEGRWRCSATLVTPTVLLTAAHCTHGTVGRTIVSFKLLTDDAAPSDVPRAPDDNATPPTGTSKTGYTTGQSLPTGWYRGTASTHPSLHRRGRPEAHAADPADQRQRARHPRRWRLVLRRLGRPVLQERLRRHGHQLRLHVRLPLPGRAAAGGQPGRPGLGRPTSGSSRRADREAPLVRGPPRSGCRCEERRHAGRGGSGRADQVVVRAVGPPLGQHDRAVLEGRLGAAAQRDRLRARPGRVPLGQAPGDPADDVGPLQRRRVEAGRDPGALVGPGDPPDHGPVVAPVNRPGPDRVVLDVDPDVRDGQADRGKAA